MAIFHMNISKISKSTGASAVKSSSYIHREKWERELTGEIIDYRKKVTNNEDVYSMVLLPKNAPEEFKNPKNLWNSVEKIEKNSNALLARRVIVALPRELSIEDDQKLLKEYCQKTFVEKGMCADIGIHWNENNPHAHIMLTTRPISKNGKWGAKETKVYKLDDEGNRIPILDENGNQKTDKRNRKQWQRERVGCFAVNHTNIAEEWRSLWAKHVNRYLAPEKQIDHRSFERQGLEIIPTIHEGYAARKMEKQGKKSEKCEINRQIKAANENIAQLEIDLKKINEEIKEEERKIQEYEEFEKRLEQKWRDEPVQLKTAIKGKIKERPELETHTRKDGKEYTEAEFTLLVKTRDIDGKMVDVPLKCTAFNERAEEIYQNYRRDDMFCGVANMRADHWKDRNGNMHQGIRWNFTAVDPGQQLAGWQAKALTLIGKGEIDDLAQEIPEVKSKKNPPLKTALKGKLSETPELKTFRGEDGKEHLKTEFTLFVPDPNTRDKNDRMLDTPFKCTAFGAKAEEICKNYKKGDMLCGAAVMRADHWKDRNGNMHQDIYWKFTAIDPEKQLAIRQSDILTSFEKGKIEIGDLMQLPAKEKDPFGGKRPFRQYSHKKENKAVTLWKPGEREKARKNEKSIPITRNNDLEL